MLKADYHTHTTYSDGKSTLEDNVLAALKAGLPTLAVSDHAWGHLFYGFRKKDLPRMREEVKNLRLRYPELRILLGIEANILGPSGRCDLSASEMEDFDLVLAGYHFGSLPTSFSDVGMHLVNYLHRLFGLFRKKAVEWNTNALIGAMERYPFLILTHPGDKGPVDILKVADAASRCGKLLEINERHRHLTTEQLHLLKDHPVRFVLSSDAHQAQHVGKVEDGLQRLKAAEIDLSRVVNDHGKESQ